MGARQVRGPARWLFLGGAATLAASAVWAVWAVHRDGMQPQDVAGVLGLPLGVFGLLVGSAISLSALRLQRASDGLGVALDRLAGSVEDVEVAERTHMLGTGAHLIDLHVDVEPRGGGAAPRGRQRLSDVARWYCDAPDRLVVTGPPGAGKTVLAVHLVVRLLEARVPGSPVPVRLSIRDLPPPRTRRWWGRRKAGGGLERWLTTSLVTSYAVPGPAAAELVARRLIVPVIEGLDDMDADIEGSGSGPVRALHALEQLNAYQAIVGSAPLVVTCRERRYLELDGQQGWLREATHLRIDGVDADQARSYVSLRSDGRSSPMHTVADAMREAAPGSPVAEVLSSPFYLRLALSVYGAPTRPRRLLAGFSTAEELREYLLTHCVTAATAAANAAVRHARQSVRGARSVWAGQAEYDPSSVHRWLHHMAGPEGRITPVGRIVGRRVTLALSVVVALELVVPVLLVVPDELARLFPQEWWVHREGAVTSWAAVVGAAPTLGVLATESLCAKPWLPSERVGLRRQPLTEKLRDALRGCATVLLGSVLGCAVMLGAAARFSDWYEDIPDRGWYVIGCAVVVFVACLYVTGEPFVAHAGRQELLSCVALPALGWGAGLVARGIHSASGFAVWAVIVYAVFALLYDQGMAKAYSIAGGCLAVAIAWEPAMVAPENGFGSGAAFGAVLCYVMGCALLGSDRAERTRSAVRYVERLMPVVAVPLAFLVGMGGEALLGFGGAVFVAVVIAVAFPMEQLTHGVVLLTASLLGRMPLAPDTFLAWAYHAGLLRIVGGAYQFRHSELQEWLHRNPVPPANH